MSRNGIAKADQAGFGLPAWMVQMREAAQKGMTENDIKEIVANQVKRAKEGDKNAIRFVMDFALGGSAFKGATFVQNNFGSERPDKPTRSKPGTTGKLDAMAARAAAGLPLCSPGDGSDVDLS